MKITEMADNMRGQFKTVVQKAAGAVHSRLGNYLDQKGGSKKRKKNKK